MGSAYWPRTHLDTISYELNHCRTLVAGLITVEHVPIEDDSNLKTQTSPGVGQGINHLEKIEGERNNEDVTLGLPNLSYQLL